MCGLADVMCGVLLLPTVALGQLSGNHCCSSSRFPLCPWMLVFLCCQLFNSEWLRKKRKRLHGESCSEARTLLEEISLSSFGLSIATHCQRYESYDSIFLCNKCEKQLTDVLKCEQRSQGLRKTVGNTTENMSLLIN